MTHEPVGWEQRAERVIEEMAVRFDRLRRRVSRLLPEDFLGRVILASAVVHVAVAIVMYAVERPPYYGWDPTHGVVRKAEQKERPRVTGEPLTPIDWDFEVRVHANLRVRATEPIATETLERMAEVYDRSTALFPSYVGRVRVPLGPLELRVLPVEYLNDPIYFAHDEGSGLIYGLYYPGSNIGYVTPTAFERTDHLVHEFCHHLFDEYNVLLPNVEEEVRARRFETFVRRFETLLEREHVHSEEPPALRAWVNESHLVVSEHGITVRSLMVVNHKRVAWLRRVNRAARALLPTYTERDVSTVRPLEIRVVKSAVLNNPKLFAGAATGRTDGRYFPDHDLLYVTPRAFETADVLSHYLAHHYLSHVEIDDETAARIAYGFGFDMERRLLRAVSTIADATTAADIDGERARTLGSAVLERVDGTTRAPR